jgi:hypothetical protein
VSRQHGGEGNPSPASVEVSSRIALRTPTGRRPAPAPICCGRRGIVSSRSTATALCDLKIQEGAFGGRALKVW